MTIDLGSYDFDAEVTVPPPRPVDTSGKPAPTQAYLVTADGYRVAADITFDGIDPSGDRRYALIIESDWLSLRLAACELDRHPPDVRVLFKLGDFNENRQRQLLDVLRNVKWIVGA